MRKLVKWILNILSLVCALLLAGAYLSRYISPSQFWPLSFLGLFFPVILSLSIFLLIFLIITKNKTSLLLIAVILIGWTPIKESIRFSSKSQNPENSEGINIMSYNVRIFDNFKWSGQENSGQLMLDFVAEQEPDIICFQEFMVKTIGDFGMLSIRKKLGFAPYVHTKFINEGLRNRVGLAIFSKYPIVNRGGKYLSDKGQLFIYADVKINNDTIRIFNNHLESNRLNQKQINLIDSIINNNPREKKKEYLDIIKNMKSAYINRAEQADRLHDEILKSPHPVIVAGDFNDTPVGYVYHKISKHLEDAFVVSGKGLGATYREFILPVRIDYLLSSPALNSYGFKRHNLKLSDHRPIEAHFHLEGSKRERR